MKAVENDQAGVPPGGILRDAAIDRPNMRISLEYGTQQLRLVGIDRYGERFLLRQFQHGAVVGRKRVTRQQARFEQARGAGSMLEQRFLLGSGRQSERSGPNGSAAEMQGQVHGARLGAVISHGDEDLPYRGIG